jgi:hypothetical protein
MNQQSNANNLTVDSDIAVDEAWDLLFGEGTLDEDIRIEEEANCTIGAGLDWGNGLGFLLLNPGLFGRLTTLRISLHREARLTIETWDLGVATTKKATQTARERIKEKFLNPTPSIQEHFQSVLEQDDLYGEEFISNREVLLKLLMALLNASDWEAIAVAAANSVREQVLSHAKKKIEIPV